MSDGWGLYREYIGKEAVGVIRGAAAGCGVRTGGPLLVITASLARRPGIELGFLGGGSAVEPPCAGAGGWVMSSNESKSQSLGMVGAGRGVRDVPSGKVKTVGGVLTGESF